MNFRITSAALSIFVMALVFAGTAAAADRYKIDTGHSAITFAVKHMVISKAKGRFGDFDGMIVYDEKDVTKSSVEVTIKTESIDTSNERRDEDLKGEGFFDVEKYPEITFKSRQIRNTKDGFVAVGTLTMHGVSKEIEIPFEITGVITDPWGGVRMGVAASLALNRQDYGITWSEKLDNGGLVVADEVEIDIEIEARKQTAKS